MAFARNLLSRRKTVALLGLLALVFGLAMLHPYPRQSLFGPTIRGEPWCVWEDAVRRQVHREEYEKTLWAKMMRLAQLQQDAELDEELFDNKEMLPLVLALADDPDSQVRQFALIAIAKYDNLHDDSALPVLRKRLQDEDERDRLRAARAIWEIEKDKDLFPIVLTIVNNRQSPLRRFAMGFFLDMSHRCPELLPQIATYANDPDPFIRRDVMVAMYRRGKQGVTTLMIGLDDDNREVRENAAMMLGLLGADAKDAIAALLDRLNDKEEIVRIASSNALAEIEPKTFKHLRRTKNY